MQVIPVLQHPQFDRRTSRFKLTSPLGMSSVPFRNSEQEEEEEEEEEEEDLTHSTLRGLVPPVHGKMLAAK